MAEEQQEQHLEITLPEQHRGGVWSNFAVVTHSPYEFTIDFARLEPGGGAIVVSRVNLSPLMVSQLLDALQDNWAKYAQKAMPKEINGHGSDD